MKIGNHLSIISIFLALVLLAFKLSIDIEIYNLKDAVYNNDDNQPTLIVGGFKILTPFIIAFLIPLLLSVIGFNKNNRYRLKAVILNIIVLIYLVIPVGFILAFI